MPNIWVGVQPHGLCNGELWMASTGSSIGNNPSLYWQADHPIMLAVGLVGGFNKTVFQPIRKTVSSWIYFILLEKVLTTYLPYGGPVTGAVGCDSGSGVCPDKETEIIRQPDLARGIVTPDASPQTAVIGGAASPQHHFAVEATGAAPWAGERVFHYGSLRWGD